MQIFNFDLIESSTVKKLTVLKILKYTLGMVLVARFTLQHNQRSNKGDNSEKNLLLSRIRDRIRMQVPDPNIHLSKNVRIQPNWPPYKTALLVYNWWKKQCSGSASGIRCLFDLDLGFGMFNKSGSGSGINYPDKGWTTRIILPRAKKHLFRVKIPILFDADPG